MRAWFVTLLFTVTAPSFASAAEGLCKGKSAGHIYYFDQEISRDKPLPKPVDKLSFDGPMFALLCLADKVGPQPSGGEKFRVVLYVKQLNIPKGQHSDFVQSKQEGVFRPQLSQPRGEVIISMGEDFGKGLKYDIDPGEYEFRLQGATEQGTGKLDVQLDFANDVAYVQELRKAGYVADGKINVVRAKK